MAYPTNVPIQYVQQGQHQFQEMPISSDEIYAGQLHEDKIKNIISQISPENQLTEIEMRIRGYKKDITSGQWVKINPKCPENKRLNLLIDRYISYLSAIMNQNTTMGNLSGMQITAIMKQVIEWLTDDLDANAEEYGLGGVYTERTRIGHIFFNSTFLVLNRSLNGVEARRMWASLSLSESSNPNMQGQNKSEWWKFWKP